MVVKPTAYHRSLHAQHVCAASGEVGFTEVVPTVGGVGGGGGGEFISNRYAVTTRMISGIIKMGSDASRFNVSLINCAGQGHETVSINYNFFGREG